MTDQPPSSPPAAPSPGRRFGCLHVILFVLGAVVLTVVVTFFILKAYVFPSEFKPTKLNPKEAEVLNTKLESLDMMTTKWVLVEESGDPPGEPGATVSDASKPLEPEAYRENDADRMIRFTEREINSLIAGNTNLARRVAIDFSQDLVSAKILIPLDEDFPVFGGNILRAKAGLSFAYTNETPMVILRGVTLMGVPLPNAWLGGLKNIDLVKEFKSEGGFWKGFSDGVEDIRVEDGLLIIRLRE